MGLKPGRMGGDLDGGPEASQWVRVRRVGKRAPDVGELANALSSVAPAKASAPQPAEAGSFSTGSPTVHSRALMPSIPGVIFIRAR